MSNQPTKNQILLLLLLHHNPRRRCVCRILGLDNVRILLVVTARSTAGQRKQEHKKHPAGDAAARGIIASARVVAPRRRCRGNHDNRTTTGAALLLLLLTNHNRGGRLLGCLPRSVTAHAAAFKRVFKRLCHAARNACYARSLGHFCYLPRWLATHKKLEGGLTLRNKKKKNSQKMHHQKLRARNGVIVKTTGASLSSPTGPLQAHLQKTAGMGTKKNGRGPKFVEPHAVC